ncbi:MAG: hypothetical protein PUD20_07300 [bacterium]|nr:hypothetical protein [bacterium]
MSMSINDSMYSYLTQTADQAKNSASASAVSGAVDKLNAQSSEEEMKQAIKDFESYFVEQLLKQVQESLKDDDESANGQMTDYFMGHVNEQIADKIVDQVGDRITQTLYEQMRRNYNIPEATEAEEAATEGVTAEEPAIEENATE